MVHGDIAIRVCPAALVMWNVGIDDVEDHIGDVVIELLCNTLLGACKPMMVTGKFEQISELGLGDGLCTRGRTGKGQG